MDELRDLEQLPALERVKRAGDLVTRYQELVSEAARIRREGAEELLSQGWDQKRIAKELKITPARVGQILGGGPQPERALLGRGALTVAIGGKWETDKPNPATRSAMASNEALAAYQVIERAAASYKLDATCEIVKPPGLVDLNRPNLVVLGSPRILPIVGQVLQADPYLGFGNDHLGWYLIEHDTGAQHRSPCDKGEDVDYAYVGRLPRPDRKSSFLYVAGIHAMGTKGAALHLVNNLPDIWGQAGKSRYWSALVRVQYEPGTREVTLTEFTTPIRTY